MHPMKAIRLRLGVSQYEIATGMGCSQSNVCFYERGQTIPPDRARSLIYFARSKGLELTYEHIYGGAQLPLMPRKTTNTEA